MKIKTKGDVFNMSEKLDKMIEESISKDGTFKSFSDRIKEGKERVNKMLEQAEDLERDLQRLKGLKEE